MYVKVNHMLGDIVKVTPPPRWWVIWPSSWCRTSSTPENIVERGEALTFPDSVVSYFKGMMGQPAWGFPEDLQKVVLKGEEPITCRPGKLLPPVDFDQLEQEVRKFRDDPERKDLISYAMYPKVYEDFCRHRKEYGYITRMAAMCSSTAWRWARPTRSTSRTARHWSSSIWGWVTTTMTAPSMSSSS